MKKRIRLLVGTLVAAALLSLVIVSAQQPQPPHAPRPQEQPRQPQPPPPPNDPFGDTMFPPEMVMQHQRELALTDEQKTFMRSEIQKTTMRFNELQWQLQDSMEALGEILKGNSVNEQQALAQLDKVLDAEREIKRLHVGMAIRIKNKLTSEQQAKLQAMKLRMYGPGPEGGPGRGPGPGGPEPGPALPPADEAPPESIIP